MMEDLIRGNVGMVLIYIVAALVAGLVVIVGSYLMY